MQFGLSILTKQLWGVREEILHIYRKCRRNALNPTHFIHPYGVQSKGESRKWRKREESVFTSRYPRVVPLSATTSLHISFGFYDVRVHYALRHQSHPANTCIIPRFSSSLPEKCGPFYFHRIRYVNGVDFSYGSFADGVEWVSISHFGKWEMQNNGDETRKRYNKNDILPYTCTITINNVYNSEVVGYLIFNIKKIPLSIHM